MTSTNDDKDVKNTKDDNATKGKSQFVEINRSLEFESLNDVPFVQRAPVLAAAWRAATCPPASPNLLRNLHRITLLYVLQEEWPKLEESLQTDMRTSVEACALSLEAAGARLRVARRLRYLLRTAAHPWHHPTLCLIMDGGQPQKEQVESWFREECCAGALERLRQLCAAGGSACSGAGLRLARALLLLPAAAGARHAALDALLVLLVRAGNTTDCITEIKALDKREAVAVIARLSTRDKSSGRLWKHAHDTALLCAQVMVAACIVSPLDGGQLAALAAQLTSLYKSRPDRLSPALRKLLQPAETAMHIYIVCRAVQHQFGETMRAFVCELYIRALTTGMNELERQKLQGEDSAAAKTTSHQLAGWFLNLADYLSSNCSVSSECVLTAFSLHPSRECYQRVEECSTMMRTTKKFQEPEDRTSLSMDDAKLVTDSVNASRSHLNTCNEIVITKGEVSDAVEGLIRLGLGVGDCISEQSSEKCLNNVSGDSLKKNVDDGFSDVCDGNGLAQRLVSGAVLDEGEGLGLTVETCRDLAVLLSGPRLKMLTWELSWKDLSRHCLSYMKDTQEGTKAVTRELKYLHLDYSQYEQIEPEVHDIYFGIEKGYEHHLEIEEEDEEDYWEEDLQDFNEDNVDRSAEEVEYVDGKKETKKVKKKSSKKHIPPDGEGPVKVKKPDKCKQPKKEKKPKEEKTCSKGKGKHKKVITQISPTAEIIECEIVQDDAHLVKENVSKDYTADDREKQTSSSTFERHIYNRKSLSLIGSDPSTSFEKSGQARDIEPIAPITVVTSTNQANRSKDANKHVSQYRLQMDRFEAWQNQRYELELGLKKGPVEINTHIKSELESKYNSTSSIENNSYKFPIDRKVSARVPRTEKSKSERTLMQDNSYRRYDLADGEEELIRKNVLAELLSENKTVIRTVESARPPTIKAEPPSMRSSLLAFRKNNVKKVLTNTLPTNVTVPSLKVSLPSQATFPTDIIPNTKISLLQTANIVPNSKISFPQSAIPTNIVPNSKINEPNTVQTPISINIVPEFSLPNSSQAAISTNIITNSKVGLPKNHLLNHTNQILEQNADCPRLDSTLLRLGQQNTPITPVNSKITCTDHSIARLSSRSAPGNANQRTSRINEQLPRENFIFNPGSQRSLPKPLEDPRLELMRQLLPQTNVKVYSPKSSNRNLDPHIINRPHPDPSFKQSDHTSRNQRALNIVNKGVSASIHKSNHQLIPKVLEGSTPSILQSQQQMLDKHLNFRTDKIKSLKKLELKKEPIDVSDMLVCDEKLLESWLEQDNTIRNLTQVPGYTFHNKPVYVQKPQTRGKVQKNQIKNLVNTPKSAMSAIRSAYLESVQNYPTDLLTKNDNRPVIKHASKSQGQYEGSGKKNVKDDKPTQKTILKTGDVSQQMNIQIANYDSSKFTCSPRKKEQIPKLSEKDFKQQCEEMCREPAVNDALSKLNKITDIQIQKLQSKHLLKTTSSPVSVANEPMKLAIPHDIKTIEKSVMESVPSQIIVNPVQKIVQDKQVTKNNVENASIILKEKQKSISLNTAVVNATAGINEANEYQTFLSEMQAMVNAGSGSQSTQDSNPKDVAVERCITNEGVLTKSSQAVSRKLSNIKEDKDNVVTVPCQDKQTHLINSFGEKVKFSPIKIANAPTIHHDNKISNIDSCKIKEVLQSIQSKPTLLKDSQCLGTRVDQRDQENANSLTSCKTVKKVAKKSTSPVLQTYARKNYCSIMKKQSALKALEMALTQNQVSSDDNSVALRVMPQQQLHNVPKTSKNMPLPQNRNLDQSSGVLGKIVSIDRVKKSTSDSLQKDTDNLQVAISRITGNNDLVVKHPNKPTDSLQEQIKKVCAMIIPDNIPIVRTNIQNLQKIDTRRASPKKKERTPISVNLPIGDLNKLQTKVKSSIEKFPPVPKSDSRPLSIPGTSQETSGYKEPWTPLQWGLRHVKNLSDVSITHQPLPSFSTFIKRTTDASDNVASAEIPVPYFVSGSSTTENTPSEIISEHLTTIIKIPKPSSDPPLQIDVVRPLKTEVALNNVLIKELLSDHISINKSQFVEPVDIHSHKDASNKSSKEQISAGGSFKIERTNIAQCSAEPVEQKFNDTNDISDLMDIIEGDLGSHKVKPVPVEITGSERSDIHITQRDIILENLSEVVHSKSHSVIVNNKEDLGDSDWSSDVMGSLSQLNQESNVVQVDKNVLKIPKTEASLLVSCNHEEILRSEPKYVNITVPKEDCPADITSREELGTRPMKIAVTFPETVHRQFPLKSSLPEISETISKVNLALKECRTTVIDKTLSKKSKACIKRRTTIDTPTETQDRAASENLSEQSIDNTRDLVNTLEQSDDQHIAISKVSVVLDSSKHPVDLSNEPDKIVNPIPLKELHQNGARVKDCHITSERLPENSKVPSDSSNSSESCDSFTILEKLPSIAPENVEFSESSRDSFTILEELANEPNTPEISNIHINIDNISRESAQLDIPELSDRSSIILELTPEVSKVSKEIEFSESSRVSNSIPKDISNVKEIPRESNEFEKFATDLNITDAASESFTVLKKIIEDSNVSEVQTSPYITEPNNSSPPAAVLNQPDIVMEDSHILKELQEVSTASKVPIDSSDNMEVQKIKKLGTIPEDCISKELKDDSTASEFPIDNIDNISIQKRPEVFDQTEIVLRKSNVVMPKNHCISLELKDDSNASEVPIESVSNTEVQKMLNEFEIVTTVSDAIAEEHIEKELRENSTTWEVPIEPRNYMDSQKSSDDFGQSEIIFNNSEVTPEEHLNEGTTTFDVLIKPYINIDVKQRSDEFEQSEIVLNKSDAIPEEYIKENTTTFEVPIDTCNSLEMQVSNNEFEKTIIVLHKSDTVSEKHISTELIECSNAFKDFSSSSFVSNQSDSNSNAVDNKIQKESDVPINPTNMESHKETTEFTPLSALSDVVSNAQPTPRELEDSNILKVPFGSGNVVESTVLSPSPKPLNLSNAISEDSRSILKELPEDNNISEIPIGLCNNESQNESNKLPIALNQLESHLISKPIPDPSLPSEVSKDSSIWSNNVVESDLEKFNTSKSMSYSSKISKEILLEDSSDSSMDSSESDPEEQILVKPDIKLSKVVKIIVTRVKSILVKAPEENDKPKENFEDMQIEENKLNQMVNTEPIEKSEEKLDVMPIENDESQSNDPKSEELKIIVPSENIVKAAENIEDQSNLLEVDNTLIKSHDVEDDSSKKTSIIEDEIIDLISDDEVEMYIPDDPIGLECMEEESLPTLMNVTITTPSFITVVDTIKSETLNKKKSNHKYGLRRKRLNESPPPPPSPPPFLVFAGKSKFIKVISVPLEDQKKLKMLCCVNLVDQDLPKLQKDQPFSKKFDLTIGTQNFDTTMLEGKKEEVANTSKRKQCKMYTDPNQVIATVESSQNKNESLPNKRIRQEDSDNSDAKSSPDTVVFNSINSNTTSQLDVIEPITIVIKHFQPSEADFKENSHKLVKEKLDLNSNKKITSDESLTLSSIQKYAVTSIVDDKCSEKPNSDVLNENGENRVVNDTIKLETLDRSDTISITDLIDFNRENNIGDWKADIKNETDEDDNDESNKKGNIKDTNNQENTSGDSAGEFLDDSFHHGLYEQDKEHDSPSDNEAFSPKDSSNTKIVLVSTFFNAFESFVADNQSVVDTEFNKPDAVTHFEESTIKMTCQEIFSQNSFVNTEASIKESSDKDKPDILPSLTMESSDNLTLKTKEIDTSEDESVRFAAQNVLNDINEIEETLEKCNSLPCPNKTTDRPNTAFLQPDIFPNGNITCSPKLINTEVGTSEAHKLTSFQEIAETSVEEKNISVLLLTDLSNRELETENTSHIEVFPNHIITYQSIEKSHHTEQIATVDKLETVSESDVLAKEILNSVINMVCVMEKDQTFERYNEENSKTHMNVEVQSLGCIPMSPKITTDEDKIDSSPKLETEQVEVKMEKEIEISKSDERINVADMVLQDSLMLPEGDQMIAHATNINIKVKSSIAQMVRNSDISHDDKMDDSVEQEPIEMSETERLSENNPPILMPKAQIACYDENKAKCNQLCEISIEENPCSVSDSNILDNSEYYIDTMHKASEIPAAKFDIQRFPPPDLTVVDITVMKKNSVPCMSIEEDLDFSNSQFENMDTNNEYEIKVPFENLESVKENELSFENNLEKIASLPADVQEIVCETDDLSPETNEEKSSTSFMCQNKENKSDGNVGDRSLEHNPLPSEISVDIVCTANNEVDLKRNLTKALLIRNLENAHDVDTYVNKVSPEKIPNIEVERISENIQTIQIPGESPALACHTDSSSGEFSIQEEPQHHVTFFVKSEAVGEKIEVLNADVSTSEDDEELIKTQEDMKIICDPGNPSQKIKEKSSFVGMSISRDFNVSTSEDDEEFNVSQEEESKKQFKIESNLDNMNVSNGHLIDLVSVDGNENKIKEELSVGHMVKEEVKDMDISEDDEIDTSGIPRSVEIKEVKREDNLTSDLEDAQTVGFMECSSNQISIKEEPSTVDEPNILENPDEKLENPIANEMCKQSETPMEIFDEQNLSPHKGIVKDINIKGKSSILIEKYLNSSESHVENMDKNIEYEMFKRVEENTNLIKDSLEEERSKDTIEEPQYDVEFSNTAVKMKNIKSSTVSMVMVKNLSFSESDATVLSKFCLEDNDLSLKSTMDKPQTEKPYVVHKCQGKKAGGPIITSEIQTPFDLSETVFEYDASEKVDVKTSGKIIDVPIEEYEDIQKIFNNLPDLHVKGFREGNPVFKNPIRTYQKTASSSSTRKRKLNLDVHNSPKNPRINLPVTQDRNVTSVDEVVYDNFSVKEILMMDDFQDNALETTEEDLEVDSFDKLKFDQNDFLFDVVDVSNFENREESPRESFYSPIFTEDERNRDMVHPVDDFIVNNIDMDDVSGVRKANGSGFREGFGFRSGREDTSDLLHGRPYGPTAALPDSPNPRLPRTPHTIRASQNAEECTTIKVPKLLEMQANSENRFNNCMLEKRARKHLKKTRRSVSPLGNRNRIKQNLLKTSAFTDLKESKIKSGDEYSVWSDDIFSRIPGMRDLDFIRPTPMVAVVNVVQLGQLPVSSAQQSPMPGTPTRTNTTGEYLDITSNNSAEYRSPTHEDSRQSANNENELPNLSESNAEGSVKNHNAIDSTNNEINDVNNAVSESPKTEDKHFDNAQNSSETVAVQDALNLSTSTTSHLMDGNVQLIFTSQPLTQHTYVTSDVQSEHKEVSRESIIETSLNSTHTTNANFIPVSRAQTLVNILSQKILRPPVSGVGTQQLQMATFPKGTPINALSLQQALAQILPPPLSQASSDGSTSVGHSSGPQVVHIVQGKTGGQPGSSFSGLLMDSSQQSVVSASGGTQVLHIVQGKNTTATSNSGVIGQTQLSGATFGGLSLVDGSQQSGNQVLHILNAGSQAKHNAAATQLLKRVNLLTSLTNTQGNEQKMVQFLCKSADGKSIQLSSQHQRGMVLRLQPIQSETPTSVLQKTSESPGVITNANPMQSGIKKSPQSDQSQEIKSRSIYEENYAKFIQNSSSKLSPISPDRSTSLPKFNQAFGKSVFQDSNSVLKNNDSVECNQNQPSTVSNEQQAQDLSTAINLAQMGQLSSPPLLIRKTHQPGSTQNLVGQVKPSGTPMNIQTMHGGVIYTRQIPVNIGGGQTINLITVPSSDIIDEAHLQAIQKQAQEKANEQQGEQQVIKLVSQDQQQQQSVCHMDSASDDANQGFAEQTQNTVNTHPLLTQMRIKVPMLSKGGTQMVAGTRVVRPVLQIQRNVIPGTNPAVYQQLVLTTAPALRPPTPAPQQPVRPPRPPTTPQQESNLSSSTLEQLREFDMVLEQVKERSTVQPGSNSNSAFSESSPQRQNVDNSDIISSQPNVGQTTQREVLYSIGPNQTVNVTYVNQKVLTSTASVLGSSYSSNPESPAIVNIGQQNSPSLQIAHGLSNSINHPKPNTPTKISTKSMKPKTTKPPSNITPSSSKASPVAPKTSLQKPLEDEQTTQRILYILAEYKEQVENSPDKDKPAPRRRSNPPTNPSTSSKRKKGSSSSSKKGGNGQSMQEMSPSGDDTGHTMGSEDSSCGLSQGDCADNSIQGPESQSPQGSPQKAARKLVFPQEQEVNVTPVTQPQRNIVIADGQTIAMTRPGPGGKATAVLMPANYLLPMSMMKGGQQITIVTNQGPKILSVPHGEGGTTNTLFLQRLISPAGLKPMLTRPGQVRQVRLPANTVQNLQAFNLTTSNTNSQDINWIGSNSLNNQQPKLLVEYSPNVTVGQDLNPDSVKSEASDAQSLKEENMSVGSESLATPRHSDSREALSDDLNMKSNRSGDEGIFSGQTDSATDDSIQSSIQNRTEQILQHIQVSKNTTNHTVNLIQVHSLNPNEPGKIFSVQNPASLGSLIQLAGKTSLGQTFQTINVSGMNQDNSKISQEVQECAQNLLLVRKQFDGQFAMNETVNEADLKSSSSIGMQQDLQSVDASPSPSSQQNYGLSHGDQLDDSHSLKVNSDANVPWSLTSNGGSTASHGGDGASPAYVGYGNSPPSLAHHRDNGMREHADDGRVLRHPYSPETESPTPGAPRHLYHKMFISSPDKQDHIGNDDKGYHHQDHHLKKEDSSQSSTITLHTSNSPSFTIHHHQHHSAAHHAQPHHHTQPSHHHTQPSHHHGKGTESRGGPGAEHGRSGGQGSVPAHVLRHKYALIEHELRLQKSLSEECEDLGVDSPSASDLFPEAELLFAASPSSQFDQSQDGQTAAPPPPLVGGLKDDHIGPVEEEFARMHPNTTFHSGEIEIGGDEADDITFRGAAAKRSAVRSQHNRRNEVVRSVIEGVGSSGMPTSYQPSKMNTHFSMVGLPRRTLNVMSSLQSSDDNSEGADSMNSESKDGLVNNKHLDGMLNSDIARDVNLAESPGCIASNIIQRNIAQVIRHANEGQLSLAGKDNTGKLCNESSPGIAQNGRSFLLESSNDTRPGDSMILKTLMMERDGRDGLTCSSPEQHSELFWESNSNSNQSEEPLPHHGPTNLLDFSSEDSNKCCKSPASCEETNSTDSSSIGGHNAESHKPLRLNSVIKTGNSSSAADGPILHSALTANLPNISGQEANRKLELNASHNDSNTSTSPDGEDPNSRRTWGRSLKSSGMRRVLSPRSLSAEINMGAEIETSSSEGVNILTKKSGGSVMHSGSSTPEEAVPAGRRASLRGTGQARRSCHCCPPPSPAPHAPQSSKGRNRRKPPPTAH